MIIGTGEAAPGKEASERGERDIEAQLKRKGPSTEKLEKKGLDLRYISSEEKLDRWIDANTALLYAVCEKSSQNAQSRAKCPTGSALISFSR